MAMAGLAGPRPSRSCRRSGWPQRPALDLHDPRAPADRPRGRAAGRRRRRPAASPRRSRDEFGEPVRVPGRRLRVGTSAADITEATALHGGPRRLDRRRRWRPRLLGLRRGEPGRRPAPRPGRRLVRVRARSNGRRSSPSGSPTSSTARRQTVHARAQGSPSSLSLDAARLATLQVEPLEGSVGVATSWSQPIDHIGPRTRSGRHHPNATVKPAGTPRPGRRAHGHLDRLVRSASLRAGCHG